jgi:hypothetical protein
MFFADPLPDNLITVPTCKACNAGVKHDEEYLRVFLTALRGHTPGQAIEDVRARVMRQLEYQPGLRRHFLNNYRASINLAGARQTGWQRITRHLDHAADDCRWQALR